LFGFCITHILNTGCAKIKKKIRRQKVKISEVAGGLRKIVWTTKSLKGKISFM
jgi:hypothetical protein